METLLKIILIGVGATALTDLWGYARGPLLGVAAPNYALVGRWFAHMRYGRFAHASIAQAPAMTHERLLGWSAHYLIGVAYAFLLIAVSGVEWLQRPTPAPALLVGIATVLVPMLWMQPAMGAGIASARTPRPNQARLHSLLLHGVFGLGLYLSGLLLSFAH